MPTKISNKKYLSKGIKDKGVRITFETTEKKNYLISLNH